MIRLLVALCIALTVIARAEAHDLKPSYLAITESAPDTYSVLWKAPAMGEMRLAVYPRLPESAAETTPREGAFMNDAYIERWTVSAPTGFAGETIAFDGLAESRTDVIVRIERLSGEVSTARATSASPSIIVPAATGWQQVATAYVWLGVEHILFGIDHLLFVLALILLARRWSTIALTITAFTVAHSITLGAATLGYLNVPGPPVEAAIALSIVLVAVEILKSRAAGDASITARFPWVVAFGFGLLHGLGFAGALSEVGLPSHAIPAGAAVLQHRGGAGAARLHGGRAGVVRDARPAVDCAASFARQRAAGLGAGRCRLLHRRRRLVLADRAGRRILGLRKQIWGSRPRLRRSTTSQHQRRGSGIRHKGT